MKSNFKKILSVILAVAMLVSASFILSSCGDNSGKQNDTTKAADSGEKQKIGMIWYGNTDAMGGTFYAWANKAAEALNVELVWKLGSYTTADELTDCENLISAGCKGIYMIPMDTSANLQLGTACQNAGVYLAMSNRDITDKDVLSAVQSNPYFVTRIKDDSYEVCKDMVKVLADKGVKKVCMLAGDPSDVMMVDRNKGFEDGAKEYGVQILATSQLVSGDATANVDSINNFLTLYPDMQGILASSGTAGVGEAIITALNSSNREKGSVKVAAFDTFEGNKEAFEQGWLAASCGGYTSECLVSFISLVNKVKGNNASDKIMELSLSPLLISSAEDMEVFSKYVDNPEVFLYSDDLVKSLVGPDVKEADYQKVLDDWSLDFVKEAAGVK